jgi:hypothetical protein
VLDFHFLVRGFHFLALGFEFLALSLSIPCPLTGQPAAAKKSAVFGA